MTLRRRDELRSAYDILFAIKTPKNENIPFRILSQTKLQPKIFRNLISKLEARRLIEIKHNVRKNGSRNKFFITQTGDQFIDYYRKSVSLLGNLDLLPSIEVNTF